MAKQIFINLAVSDLKHSVAFYEALGFVLNPQFSDETGKCMVWSDSIFVMLLSREKFLNFVKRPLADTKSHIASLFSLSLDSMDQVNQLMETSLAAGGTEPHEMRDLGFMQQRTVEDPDGYSWELFYMDMSKFPANQ